MLAKERASGACHMCQRSGCAAGAGTAHGAEPSIAHDFGLWALFGLQRVVEIAHVGQTSACFSFKSNPFFFGFGSSFWLFAFEKRKCDNQNKLPRKDIGIPATKINRIGETVQPKVPQTAPGYTGLSRARPPGPKLGHHGKQAQADCDAAHHARSWRVAQ